MSYIAVYNNSDNTGVISIAPRINNTIEEVQQYLIENNISNAVIIDPELLPCKLDWCIVENDAVVENTIKRNSIEYKELRKAEYDKLNQYEMMFNDQINGTTTWIDAINAIKAQYPKPE